MKQFIILFSVALVIFGCSTNNNGTVTVVPLAPTNLTGSVISTTQINLSWTDNATTEDGYKIERKTGTGNYAVIGSTASNMTTFSDLGLTPNTSYTYRVYGYNSAGNSLQYSNEVTLSTQDSIPSWLTNGLVGYWPFNGNANDESGNGNNGTVNGSTLASDRNGETNSSYSFNGISDFIQCLNSGPSGNGPLTLSFWYYSNSNTTQTVFSYGGSNWGSLFDASINWCPSGSGPFFGPSFVAEGTGISWGSLITQTSNWHHVVIVVPNGATDCNSLITYFDGQITPSSSFANYGAPNLNFGTSNPIQIGKSYSTYATAIGVRYANFNGLLDDIRLYNRALSASEVAYLATH